ncbi:MAG: Cytochrome o ubiquinol oxidase, subunit II [Parcubacteria group bacterium GW2011_GWC1_42_11]|nr:MAG: Cytochrome o ubiquinol oxidase, subunit II [Parcubacteria group bacterium GW2011_GWC1_42_11]KKT09918.1 MAG: Cytochrome o ubiquinol oxidase, subunit II [Candidatus Nomurabacteria bacterium GW2011_GWB1_43_20]
MLVFLWYHINNTMKKIMRVILVVAVVGVVFLMLSYTSSHNMGVFNPKGTIAHAEMNLIVTTTLLMLIVVIPVFVMLAIFSWRYRAGNTKAKYSPDWHKSIALEVIWWIIPIIIIAIIARMTWISSHDLDPYKPIASSVVPITIEVVALEWKWLFIYPDQNIATLNFVQLPIDTPINFRITGDAPMNSFWIPQLAGQIYAMAGMDTTLHIVASEKGDYAGVSANYSGFGFSGMKFTARASSQDEFEQWVRTVRMSPSTLSIDEYTKLAEKSRNNDVSYYSSVHKGLYDKIIMKFMVPANVIMTKMNM